MSYSWLLQSGWINSIWTPVDVTSEHDHKHKQEQWHKYISANICGEVFDTQPTETELFEPMDSFIKSHFFFHENLITAVKEQNDGKKELLIEWQAEPISSMCWENRSGI